MSTEALPADCLPWKPKRGLRKRSHHMALSRSTVSASIGHRICGNNKPGHLRETTCCGASSNCTRASNIYIGNLNKNCRTLTTLFGLTRKLGVTEVPKGWSCGNV